jgi:xylulokinase
MNNLFLAIDVGTSRIKVALFSRNGQMIALVSDAIETISPEPRWAEQDPETWWFSTAKIIRGMLKDHRIQQGKIRAVSVTGQMHGPVLLDAKGRPLGNCIIWQDRRAERETGEIASRVPEKVLYKLSGCRLNPYMTGPKLLWIRKNRRKHYLRARRIVLPKDYVRSRFTDDYCTDWTDANGTGLFDMRKKTWAGDILRELGLDETKMPEIRPPFEVVGEVSRSASRQTGLDNGLPVVAGGGDDAVSIGTGAILARDMAVNLGTSCSTYVSLVKPVLDPEMRLECFVGFEEGRWHLSGATAAAGASVEWIIRNTGAGDKLGRNLITYSSLDKFCSPNARPSSLLFLPYLAGERSPFWDANATGALCGLSLLHTKQDLIQSVLEGVGFTLRSILDITEELTGKAVEVVRVSGAGTSSVAWMSIIANILGKKVAVPRQSEATALGAAILGAVGTGLSPNVREAATEFVDVRRTFTPQDQNARAYESTYKRFKEISKAYLMMRS